MSLNNTCDIFEGHFPFIKKTHVILEYGKPIYPKELDKDEKKRIGEYSVISSVKPFIRIRHLYSAWFFSFICIPLSAIIKRYN